jgi:hypothetical protein
MRLESILADLDISQSQLDAARHDDTTATQCAKLTQARDLVRQARILIRAVERDYLTESKG